MTRCLDEDPQAAHEEIRIACRHDVELFAEIFFPHYCNYPFNRFHKDYFKLSATNERGVRRLRVAPRGNAKSTLVTLIKVVHDLAYGLERFIVSISNTDPLAAAKLKDIRAEILSYDLLRSVYNLRFPRANPGETQFIVESGTTQIMLMAFGARAQVRGARFGPYRPSKVVLDDVEHSEKVFNEALRIKTAQWFNEDVVKIGDTKTNIEVVGTMLHRMSLLAELKRNPAYESKQYKSVISWAKNSKLWNEWTKIYTNIDNDNRREEANQFFQAHKIEMLEGTEVLWPEKEPYDVLMKEMIEIGRRAFFKEKQNEPQGAEDKVFENLHWYEEVPEGFKILSNGAIIPWAELTENCYGAMDPATGQTKTKKGALGDFTSILTGYKDRKNRLFIHQDWTQRATPTKFIKSIFEHHERFNYQKFAVETNLYRDLLTENLVAERKRRSEAQGGKLVKIPFYEVMQTESKIERIFRLEPKTSHGWILFNVALSQEFKNQLEEFPHADHDDGPDCLEMLWNLIHNRYRASGQSLNAMGNR